MPELPKPPTPLPQFGQLGPLFSEVKIQDLKVSLELKILYIYYIIYCIYMQPKKQLKVQYIGIFEEIDSFIDQKCTSKKRAKKFGHG